jgi:hypothetical protein
MMASGGEANSYGLGTLLHEILHKAAVGGGFDHDQIDTALRNSGGYTGAVGPNPLSLSLGKICF